MATTAMVTTEEVVKMVPQVVSQAQGIVIRSHDDFELACTFLQLVAGKKKQIDDVFDPIVKSAHETHKKAVAQKKAVLDPLVMAEQNVKGKVSEYNAEQERLRRAEEARLTELARKENEERALAEAEQLEKQGDKELADLVLENAALAPAPVVVVAPTAPKFSGVSSRESWKFRIVNAALVPREYLIVNETAIGAVVRAQKSMARIPGVEVYREDSVAVRTR